MGRRRRRAGEVVRGAPRPSWRFRMIAWGVIAGVRLLRWRVDTRGLEHLPRRGGAVITWNHNSHVDFLLTAYDVYRRLDRPIRFVAMRELWDSRWLGWVPRFADAVPVERATDEGRERAFATAVAALRSGHLVLVAPESEVSRSLELLPFRTGAARMAQLAGVPLIPSVSWGTQRLATTSRPVRVRAALGAPITVQFGEPLHVGPEDDVRAVTEELGRRTAVMLDGVQRDYPDGLPRGAYWVPARHGGGAAPHRPPPHGRPDGDRHPDGRAEAS